VIHVVMPAHNEGLVIADVIQRVRKAQPDARLIVVNDGSSDDTAEIAKALGAQVVHLICNCGYGISLHTGLTYAYRQGADIVVTMDADGQHAPESIEHLLFPVRTGSADLVLGSRYLPGSVCYEVPKLRRFVSRALSLLLSLLAGQTLTDTTTGFQCMNRKVLKRIVTLRHPQERTHDADLILHAIRTGARVVEVPVVMHADQGGTSMHGVFKSAYYIPKLLIAMLSVMLKTRRMST
jgi:glycosyltransferase involved in cell wall biosynthesis